MRGTATVPYLLPPDDAVQAEPWTDHTDQQLGDRLEHWDPHTTLELNRAVTVDLDTVRYSCRLTEDACFALTTTWHASATRLADGPEPVELADLAGTVAAELAMIIPPERIGGRLDLTTRLVLRHPGTRPTAISPTIPGTTLWFDRHRVAVEGSAARFPVTASDFTATPFPDSSGWALEWNSQDLNAPLLGTLRLLVNAAQPNLVAALRSGSSDPRASGTRAFIAYDVARTMLEGALRNTEFLDNPYSFDDGTVGRAAADLLSACLPGTDARSAATLAAENPARLSTAIQSHLGTTA